MKKIIQVPKSLICIKTGKGKTLSTIFAAKYMFKHGLIDKAVFCGTNTSISAFVRDFTDKLNCPVSITDGPTGDKKFLDFLKSDEKILLCKHSMIEKLGGNANTIKAFEHEVQTKNLRIFLVIDEAHNLSNAAGVGSVRSSAGVAHSCFDRIRYLFSRICLATATPYSSCLSQFYGLIHLIYPSLWASPKAFWNDYIEVKEIRDWRTGKFQRYEPQRYINLPKLRELISPFTYFYYPPSKLHFIEHYTQLKSYKKYNELVMGVITQEDIDKAMKKAQEKAEKEKAKKLKKAMKNGK